MVTASSSGCIQRLRRRISHSWDSRHYEIRWTAIGLAVGVVVGFLVGGIGLARAGDAVGVSGVLLFGAIGAVFGNRLGIGRDKKALAINKKT